MKKQPDMLPSSPYKFLQLFSVDVSKSVGLQERITTLVLKAAQERVRGQMSVTQSNRHLSNCHATAGRLWSMPASDVVTHVSPIDYRLEARSFLGMHHTPHLYTLAGKIPCGHCGIVNLRDDPGHCFSCEKTRKTTINEAHDYFARTLRKALAANGVPQDGGTLVGPGKDKTDMKYFEGFVQVDVDVTMRYAGAPSYARTASVPLGTLEAASRAKHLDYDLLIHRLGVVTGADHRFVALPIERSGAYGKELGVFIKMVARAGLDNRVPAPLSTRQIRNLIALCVVNGNCMIAKNALNHQHAPLRQALLQQQMQRRHKPKSFHQTVLRHVAL